MTAKVWTDGTDWYIADTPEEVIRRLDDLTGCGDDYSAEDFEALSDNDTVTVFYSYGSSDTPEADAVPVLTQPMSKHIDYWTHQITRTCAEWVATSPKGLLCSTEY